MHVVVVFDNFITQRYGYDGGIDKIVSLECTDFIVATKTIFLFPIGSEAFAKIDFPKSAKKFFPKIIFSN